MWEFLGLNLIKKRGYWESSSAWERKAAGRNSFIEALAETALLRCLNIDWAPAKKAGS